eukprot:TRINITY_DN1329_c0_g1_i5.p1 TRINITY_DN1329_c0_g1~~TRINITY_DN1329_c0_g1_i5.p1  ORF type:complete len:234 (-),score=52.73 TRINITY_DN1329_c0_g1_i5:18-719(-)
MQSALLVKNMSYQSWQNPWKDGNYQRHGGTWFDQHSWLQHSDDCAPHYDEFGNWTPQHGGVGGNILGGYGGLNNNEFQQQPFDGSHGNGRKCLPRHGSHGNGRKCLPRRTLAARHGGGNDSPAIPGDAATAILLLGGRSGRPEANRVEVKADSEDKRPAVHPGDKWLRKSDDSDDEEEITKPAEATEEERQEAENIVRTAFKQAKERDRLREKVKKATASDLQELLNARLAKK